MPARPSGEVTVPDTPRRAPTERELAPLLARFEIKGTLGEGGMGQVVEAYDRVLGRDVAIKLIRRDAGGDPTLAERFLREARAAARLRHHGIVQVHDIDPDGGYIVMELVRGESLAARMHRDGKLPAAEVRRIGAALLSALGVAHAEGIIHRDVKPANVLLGKDGEVKLADFGVAFFGDSDLTMPGTRVGTPAYMAPEQLRAKDVDARSDVYAAGVTLFEAATGKRLHDDDVPPDPATAVFDATGDRVLAAAIARAVEARPSDRYENGRAFAEALDATSPALPPRVVRRRAKLAIAAVGAIVLGLGAGFYVRAHRGHAPAGPRTVALLPFSDKTHDAQLDFAAAGLPNLLGLELHGVPDVKIIGYYQLLSNVRGPDAPLDEWLAAAKKLGADVVVRGELESNRLAVHVIIRVENAAGERIDQIEREASPEGVPEIVRSSAPIVARAIVGRDVEGSHTKAPFTAERELQLGIAEIERERLAEAIDHLYAAIRVAPQLAAAHYYLAVALSWQAPPSEPARAEIDKAISLGVDAEQRGMLDGLRALVDQDFPRGIAVLRPLADKYPQNRDILYVYFEVLYHGGHPAEAMNVYRRIVALEPRFRLALVHLFTFYTSHADDAGMGWALALCDPAGDSCGRAWEPRVLVARRDYDGGIRLLSRLIDQASGSTGDLKSELAVAYLLSDQRELAQSLIHELAEQSVMGTSREQMALAILRGDDVERRKWLDLALRSAEMQPIGPPRNINFQFVGGDMLFASDKQELADLSKQIDGTIIPDYGRSLNLGLMQTLLAEQLGNRARLGELAKSPYPEVSELAAAALARADGDHARAASAMRRSIAATGDARFLIDQNFLLAGDLQAQGDHAGVVATCDEVIRPRLFSWQWAATVGPCLAMTAHAEEALGKHDLALAAWKRLAAMRTAPDDALGKQAREALAR